MLTAIAYFFQSVIGNSGKFSIPIKTEGEFNDLVHYFLEFKKLLRVSAVAALLIIFKMLVVLKDKFPSFGVLFDTIQYAKGDIINFGFITVLLLIAFSLLGYLAFGLNMREFSTFGDSLLTLFNMAFGKNVFDEMKVSNRTISGILYVVFSALFFFILLNTFLAIVVSTYRNIKKRSELLLQAKARMLKEDSDKFIEMIMNFLLFRIKTTLEEDAIEYQSLSLKTSTVAQEQEEINDKVRKLENSIIQQSKQDIFGIIKYNFGQLQLLVRGAGSSLLTREQLMQKMKNTIRTIQQEKRKIEILSRIVNNDVDYNFKLIKDMFIYIIFIIIFIVMAKQRLKIEETFSFNKIVYDSVFTPEFNYKNSNQTLAEINDVNKVYEFFFQVLVPYLSYESISTQNAWTRYPRGRMTINRYTLEENKNAFSRNAIEQRIVSDKEFNTTDLRGQSTLQKYTYFKPGSKETFDQLGGYIVDFYSDSDYKATFEKLADDEIMGDITSSIVFEWVLYNVNMNMFSYNYIMFQNFLSGQVGTFFRSRAVELDIFESSSGERTGLEIVFIIFTIYYLCEIISDWLVFWKELTEQRKIKEKGQKAVRDVLEKLAGEGPKKSVNGCEVLFDKFGNSIKHILG